VRKIDFPKMPEGWSPGDVLAGALSPPPDQGVTFDQIEKRLPIARKLRAANGRVLLEEAEWAQLVECVKAAKWLAISEEVYSLCKAVLDAEKTDVEVKPNRAQRRRNAK